MNADEIVEGIIKFLHGHKNGSGGHIHQNVYKQDLFRLFAAAVRAGLIDDQTHANYLSVDGVISIITAKDPDVFKYKEWEDVRTCWQEWSYAWKHRDQLQK